ncbi:hypothetical protein F0919_05060 [Taibaiella lutea]|uniref:DUF4393 domain-containing protein n=1 Tax=Taibaiella lutea TaxID=2608001 RepID=A0A5M6CVV5_9BACT|nr:hypothetical protein [Taibaiella lutea]KAA5537045.1 hypothetical protein F0919_05060 [Taibaiella lutea]
MKKIQTLLQILKEKKLQELYTEATEIGVEVLKIVEDVDIGYLNTGIKTLLLPNKIKEYFFIKKITRFIKELGSIPDDKRIEFIIKMEDEELDSKVGETTLIILDKLEREEKATLLGRLFKAYLEQKIDKEDFLRMSIMIERAFLEDLIEFGKNQPSIFGLKSQTRINLYVVGLLNQVIDDRKDFNNYIERKANVTSNHPPVFKYKVNEYGEMIKKYCFE